MSKDVIVYRPLHLYYIVVFVVLVAWIVAGEELSQSGLLTAWSNPSLWFVQAAALMGTMLPPLILLSWRMKQRISVGPIEWSIREREIEYDEFRQMVREYTRGYSYLQSRFDVLLGLSAACTAYIALILPFLMVTAFQLLSGWAPHVFGFTLMAFGLIVVRVVYLWIPNDASPSFPVVRARQLDATTLFVVLLRKTVGISWAGVKLSIGESSGYYTLRTPKAVGRIEGIESSAWIEISVDKSGEHTAIVAKIAIDSGELEFAAPVLEHGVSIRGALNELVRKCVAEYVKAKGTDEILDDLMTELGMSQTTPTSASGGAKGESDGPDE